MKFESITTQESQNKSNLFPLGIFIAFLLTLGYFLYPCHNEFSAQTYSGKTAMNSIIALQLGMQDGIISGKGIHRFASGIEHEVSIQGTYSCGSNTISFKEVKTDGTYFGSFQGWLDKEENNVSGSWLNSKGIDETYFDLMHVNFNPKEIMDIVNIDNPLDEQTQETLGDLAKEKVDNFAKGLRNLKDRAKNSFNK